jgi:hypothetical protein
LVAIFAQLGKIGHRYIAEQKEVSSRLILWLINFAARSLMSAELMRQSKHN